MMKKSTRIWLIVATCFVLLGGLIFVGGMTVLKWDFTKLTTAKFETNTYKIDETYQGISINVDTADIVFVPVDGEATEVICYEQEKVKHSVAVKDGTLTVEVVDTRAWYEHIGINFVSPKITVQIPRGEYGALRIDSATGDVEMPKDFSFDSIEITESTGRVTCEASAKEQMNIRTTTGDIFVSGVHAGAIDLSVSTGKVTLQDTICAGEVKINVSTGDARLSRVDCRSLISDGSTGSLSLTRVIASERFSLQRSTGSVWFDGCDAAEIFVNVSTGSVKGTLLTEKTFSASSDTGRVEVPRDTRGGKCEISACTGDIIISVD